MKQARGFTLIELAIVLVIVTILIGGLAMPLSAQIQARRIAETQRTLEEVREAIFGYALSQSIPVDHDNEPGTPDRNHTYLPCPDIDHDGLEDREPGGECSGNEGNVPWATLGTGAQDAWGNRLHYRLTSGAPNDYGNSEANSFSSASGGANQICTTSSGGCAIGNMASAVPVVLVSYGPNGRGARNVNIDPGDPTPGPPSGTSADELANLDGDTTYVSRPATDASHSDGEFDDLVVWIPHGLIISRVCGLIGCTELPPPNP